MRVKNNKYVHMNSLTQIHRKLHNNLISYYAEETRKLLVMILNFRSIKFFIYLFKEKIY